MANPFPPRPHDPDDDVDQALADVLKAVGAASCALALQDAMSMAWHGDLRRLAARLEAMTPGRLAEVAAAARMLAVEADRALVKRGPSGRAGERAPMS